MKKPSLLSAIKKVIENKEITNEEKLDRIETYLEIEEGNSRQSMSDMA